MNQIQNKNEFKIKLREQEIFDIEKNGDIRTAKDFRYKYLNENINPTRVYTRICNYRVSHYGCSFISGDNNLTKEDCIKRKQNSQHRHSYRRIKYGLRKANKFDNL